MIRQPIISVLGHVDHGKTSLLDRIRNTVIASKEAGGITQHIGASEVPIDVIKKTCGDMLKKFNISVTIPGLLFIDTPGHEAFTNLRKRGGAVADLAILVVDVTKNFEPQTYEAIDILKQYKTPFVVAANKIDLITGWHANDTTSFLETISKQNSNVVEDLDARVYSLVGKLSELGIQSERFDRVKDFKKEVVIVPLSAKTGEGIAELLMYVTGLSQKFLEARLNIEVSGPGVGSILEKKEERGLGTTIDVILYNGTLKASDTIAFATADGVRTAKIKALLKPKPLQEMREPSTKYFYVDSVNAASGVKISGSDLEEALPGSLVISTSSKDYEKELTTEMQEVFSTTQEGIILKSDTIGGLEALSRLLAGIDVKVSRKGIGNVTKRDVLDAFAMKATDPYNAVVLAFNVQLDEDAKAEAEASGVKIIQGNIIYKIIDDYKEWLNQEKMREKQSLENSITMPGKIRALPNHVFRISHPAVFGVEVLSGRIKPTALLMNKSGNIVGRVKEIQDNALSLQEAKQGQNVAISVEDITFGRQIKENDVLYTFLNDEEVRLLKYKFSYMLSDPEKDLVQEISSIKKENKSAE